MCDPPPPSPPTKFVGQLSCCFQIVANGLRSDKYIKKRIYLPLDLFVGHRLVGVRKQLKNPDPPLKGQSGARILLEHTSVKNPNWPEANHLTIYKRGRGYELGFNVKQIQVGLEPRTAELLSPPR